MAPPVLKLTNITKQFPGVLALNDVGLECVRGEVHAVVGENGSGKSTLLGIASGALAADAGSITILGHELTQASPALARKLGLGTVYQDNSLVPELSVAQNLFLGIAASAPPYGSIDVWGRRHLERCGLSLPVETPVSSLSPAQCQFLEIAKALVADPEILLLDEPTAYLDPAGVQRLHELIRHVVKAGGTVVYVSHRLPEILSLADRVTVLRDGRGQGTYPASGLSENDLIALMVGRPIEAEFPRKSLPDSATTEVALAARNLTGAGFAKVDFDLHRGEILGFAGAEENGQRDVLRALGGFEPAKGTITVNGRVLLPGAPKRAIAAGLIMLSGDRAGESIFAPLGVRENINVQTLSEIARFGFVANKRERARTREMIAQMDLVAASLDQPVGTLSGGNQQKSVLARSFLSRAEILLIDEPTQGVDARARFDIYQVLRRRAAEGTAFIIKSADAIELAGLCDRVLVFSRGRIVRELHGESLTEANIVASFLTSDASDKGSMDASPLPQVGARIGHHRSLSAFANLAGLRNRWWAPACFLLALILAVAAYAASQSPAFLTPLNGRHILRALTPLALVSMAQLSVLLVGGFDISVGAVMSLTVVLASFLLGSGANPAILVTGALLCLGCGGLVGLANGTMVRRLGISPVIATIATMSVLQGIALSLRPVPAGIIDSAFMHALTLRVGFVPYSSIALIALAVFGDFWLRRTRSGLYLRSVGLREQAARRNGIRVDRVHLAAYICSTGLAALAGLFLATEVGMGHPTVGATYTLTSIAAAVLGGASLTGGRGSFLGTTLGAAFFALVINVIPFLGLNAALSAIAGGGLTLLAVLMYSGRLPTQWLKTFTRH